MSCFWLMMYQLWDLHPNFITDWIDSSDVAGVLTTLPNPDYWASPTDRGPQVPQEILLATNAFLIIVLMIQGFVTPSEAAAFGALGVLILAALLLLRVLEPREALSGFSNPATVTVACMFWLNVPVTVLLAWARIVQSPGARLLAFRRNPEYLNCSPKMVAMSPRSPFKVASPRN